MSKLGGYVKRAYGVRRRGEDEFLFDQVLCSKGGRQCGVVCLYGDVRWSNKEGERKPTTGSIERIGQYGSALVRDCRRREPYDTKGRGRGGPLLGKKRGTRQRKAPGRGYGQERD